MIIYPVKNISGARLLLGGSTQMLYAEDQNAPAHCMDGHRGDKLWHERPKWPVYYRGPNAGFFSSCYCSIKNPLELAEHIVAAGRVGVWRGHSSSEWWDLNSLSLPSSLRRTLEYQWKTQAGMLLVNFTHIWFFYVNCTQIEGPCVAILVLL